MAKYFRVVRQEVHAHQYFPNIDLSHVPSLIKVPGYEFAVVARSVSRGVIVKIGDFVVEKPNGECTVTSPNKFLSNYTLDIDNEEKCYPIQYATAE
jgi:hypothetical protein